MSDNKTVTIEGSNAIERQLTSIRDAIENVAIGFGRMLHIQQSHGLLLQSILEAATAELEPESDLIDLMGQILSVLERQSDQLARLKDILSAQRT